MLAPVKYLMHEQWLGAAPRLWRPERFSCPISSEGGTILQLWKLAHSPTPQKSQGQDCWCLNVYLKILEWSENTLVSFCTCAYVDCCFLLRMCLCRVVFPLCFALLGIGFRALHMLGINSHWATLQAELFNFKFHSCLWIGPWCLNLISVFLYMTHLKLSTIKAPCPYGHGVLGQ